MAFDLIKSYLSSKTSMNNVVVPTAKNVFKSGLAGMTSAIVNSNLAGDSPVVSAVKAGAGMVKGNIDGFVSSVKPDVQNLTGLFSGDTSGSSGASSGTVTYPSDGGTSVTVPDYINADLAKAYGMDASTAYQEALSNTSYQRAVKDLEAAGINPMLAVNGMSGANGVYSAHLAGDGGISTGVSSAKGAHTWYKVLSNAGSIGGALLSGGNYYAAKTGNAVLGAVGNLIDQVVG